MDNVVKFQFWKPPTHFGDSNYKKCTQGLLLHYYQFNTQDYTRISND